MRRRAPEELEGGEEDEDEVSEEDEELGSSEEGEEEEDSDEIEGEEEEDEDSGEDASEESDGGGSSAEEGEAAGGSVGPDEHESDTDDEAPINTIGNVPLEWYEGMDHVGYDLDGRKIMRSARTDELDALIKRFDDPDSSRTIHDAMHGVDVVLREEDVALIRRLQATAAAAAAVRPPRPRPSR